MNELTIKNKIDIKDMIHIIRGKQVILDSDLAELYKCKNGTKTINLAVKRHINRFPERFMFRLTDEECNNFSRFQSETLNGRGHNIKYLPYAFTEQGVAMLATILRTSIAEDVSIRIMDAFVAMRKYISNNLLEQQYINELVLKDNKRIDILEEALSNFKEKNHHIFFEGQIYDAYSLLLDIFNKSKKEIIIIDNYIDKSILDILSKSNKKITLITNKYNNDDYIKYKQEYHNITLKINNSIHDRFIIIDKRLLYNCGASFKDLGKKCFALNKIIDTDILNNLLKKINS